MCYNATNIFQMGWNHQLEHHLREHRKRLRNRNFSQTPRVFFQGSWHHLPLHHLSFLRFLHHSFGEVAWCWWWARLVGWVLLGGLYYLYIYILYRTCFLRIIINHYKDPWLKNQYFMESKGPRVFFVAQIPRHQDTKKPWTFLLDTENPTPGSQKYRTRRLSFFTRGVTYTL